MATDPTGHSLDEDHWQDLYNTPDTDVGNPYNDDLTYDDLWDALHKMKSHKTPGSDSIPSNLYKQARAERNQLAQHDSPGPTTTPFSAYLLHVLNLVWTGLYIPRPWRQTTIISIPKKGDPSIMDNYRGISLMPTALKILCTIICSRLNTFGETNNLFSPNQAGFRKLEECATQAACVIKAVQRRRLCHDGTYLLFVDFRKAYDTVPHEALFCSLEHFGIYG